MQVCGKCRYYCLYIIKELSSLYQKQGKYNELLLELSNECLKIEKSKDKEEKAMLKKRIMIALDIITSIMLALKIESLVDYLTYMHTLTLLGLSEGDYLYYESSFGIISDVYRSLPYILIFGDFVLYILNITLTIIKISDFKEGKEIIPKVWYRLFILVNIIFVIWKSVDYIKLIIRFS